ASGFKANNIIRDRKQFYIRKQRHNTVAFLCFLGRFYVLPSLKQRLPLVLLPLSLPQYLPLEN
ncbi:hypothetical protein, partial [Klebsiella pneumoniae]|uniref:hypothetical protein n=1 Tax=Klebsiella pneumoniae TaxID=573 RepID=UPI001E504175